MIRTLAQALVLVMGLTCIVSGCSQSQYDIGTPLAAPQFEQGTELAQVLEQLGPPHRMSASAVGYVMAWEYWRINEEKLGISARPIGVEFISIDWGDARVRGEYLLLSFDKSHQLIDSEFSQFDRDAGGGKGIQALVSVVDVVDVDDLTEPMPQHHWGMFALEELPVTLNRNSHMDSGQHGIEQRGTPVHVGQRSTEMP